MIPLLFTLLVLIALAAAFAIIEAWADDNVIETAPAHFDRKEFHALGWTRRAFVVATAVLVHFGFAYIALATGLLAGIVFWIVFEAVISYRLTGSPFSVGTTARSDKFIRKLAYIVNERTENMKKEVMILLFCLAAIIFLLQFRAI